MEGAVAIAYTRIKAYWRRRNYHRLVNTNDMPIETPGSQSQQNKNVNRRTRRFRIRRPKLKMGRYCIRLSSIRKLFLKMRNAYISAMLGIGISSPGYDGFVSGGSKEYDEKMMVEIYKRLVLAQQQGQGK